MNGRVAAGVVLAAVVLVGNVYRSGRRAERLHQQVVSAERAANTARSVADSLRGQYEVASEALRKKAKVLVRVDSVLILRVDSVQAGPIPEGCEAVAAARDGLIRDCMQQAQNWRDQYHEQVQATGRLSGSAEALTASNDSLRAVVKYLRAPRRFFYRLTHPQVRPGAFAGLCTDARLCAGVGLTLTF
jgi:hypothetical protein